MGREGVRRGVEMWCHVERLNVWQEMYRSECTLADVVVGLD